jgi:arginyl-tRNA synthetase
LFLQGILSEYVLAGVKAAQAAGALPGCGLPAEVVFNQPKNAAWGDFSTALPMQLAREQAAREARFDPLAVAQAIQAHLPEAPFTGQVSVTPPGFLNFTFSTSWLAGQVDFILAAGASYANLEVGGGQMAQVEFVSANPTGPLSFHRSRGAAIGDTMAGLLEAAGYRVTREYYFNNAGNQMRILGESLRVRYLQALGQPGREARTTALSEEMYQGEYLAELGRRIAAEKGAALAGEGWEAFKEIAEAAMFASIQKTLGRMNVYMDSFFNENSLYEDGSVWQVLDALRARSFAYEKDGAVWLAVTRLGGTQDRVLVRSNGEPTYRLPDIAYHANKLERGFKLVIDVLGADHKDEFPDVVRGVQALGYDASGIRLLMNQFVTIKGGRMSTRAGQFIELDELIDEVGADVVRFFLLMRAAESHLEFDLELAREQSEKNPVFYVQYAHTRICSILRKAAESGFSTVGGEVRLLEHPAERALILRLLRLSEVIHFAVRDLAPHGLTTYARDLAAQFHTFYRDCLVLDPGQPALARARLKLVTAVRIGLARSLELLGVSAPEVM